MPQTTINKLLKTTPELWKGRRANHSQRNLPTGHARLDARLPGNGWPLGAVTELISRKPGLGEFSLLFPTLADMGQQGQWLVLIDPPWIPYPAALHGHGLRLERLLLVRTQSEKESLWACEQALRGSRGGAVLGWPERISFTRLRRLQLAAGENGKLLFLFRPEQAANTASPAALRLRLEADRQRGTCVNVLKCRGNRPLEPAWIPQPYSASRSQHILAPESPDVVTQPALEKVQLPASTAIN
jgi:cell division inhibitor SulA/protein ImuA